MRPIALAAAAILWFALTALSPTPAEAQPQPVGDQFQVNTAAVNAQRDPDVGMDGSGNFVVVWETYGSGAGDGDGSIRAQRYASDGSPVGDEFRVNSYTPNRQVDPRVSMNAAGEFVVVWENVYGPDYPGSGVRGKRFAPDGSVLGSEFVVSLTDDNSRPKPDVDMRDDGSFAVSWLNTFTSEVRARRFNPSGALQGPTIRFDVGLGDPAGVAALPSGQTVLFWKLFSFRERNLQARLYSSSGGSIGDAFIVSNEQNDGQPAIAADSNGDFLTVWTAFSGSSNSDGAGAAVRAQRFSSDGSPVAGGFQVNSYTTGSQGIPAAALLDNGDAFITWESTTADNDPSSSAQGAYFASDGSRIGGQFQINTFTPSAQEAPRVASDGRGRFVVVWDSGGSPGNDNSSDSIQARLYSFDVDGRVFLDLDFDGLQDPGEGGAPGVEVHLYDAEDFSLLESTSTDPAGAYVFAGRPDRYFLEFEAPEAYVFTARDRGSDDSIDSDVEPGTGRTISFLAAENGTWDVGLTNGIGDRVWLDHDADGIQDGGELGAAGVTVELFDSSDSSVASTVSDPDGHYAFADLSPGDYYVVFTAPDGFVFSAQRQGNDSEVDSDADPATGATAQVTFGSGDLFLGLDAGLIADTGLELLDGPEARGVAGDFQVNSVTTGFQYNPAAAKLADGSFVVTWQSAESSGDDNDQLSVQWRRYASDGSALGGDQQANTLTTGSQSRPDIAAAPDGGFWIAWESQVSAGDDSSSDSIQLRRFDSLGSPVGTELQANQLTSGGQRSPVIAVAKAGGAIVSWSGSSDGSGQSVPARVFDSSGGAVGNEFTVNSYTPSDQYVGDVTALDSGEFLVVWSSPTASSAMEIIGRRVGTDGGPVGGEFQISQTGGYYPTAAAGPGGFVAAWTDAHSNDLVGRFFDGSGQALGPEFVVGSSPFYKEIAAVSEERFVVTWQLPNDGDSAGVQGRLVDFPGAMLGPAFQINSYTTGVQADPQIAGDPDTGRALIVWESNGSSGDDDSGESVVGRLLQISAEIGDLVFEDSDLDGLQDADEPGLEGVTVGLYGDGGQLIGETTSNADGRFAFHPFIETSTESLAGSLRASLRFGSPAGLSFAMPNAGDDALDSDPDPVTGETDLFELRAGRIDRTWDAGLAAGVGNRIWLDADGNGVQDGGEAGFAGATVTLLDGQGLPIDQTLSDSSGAYSFTGLESGVYSVEVTLPAGYEFTLRDQGSDDAADSDVNAAGRSSSFLYVEGSIDADLDVGLVPETLAAVGDRVWLDANLNGIQDGGEAGFAGVVVELFTSDGVSQGTTTTDAGGSYLFGGLAAGDYFLVFSEPAGFCYTARNQGNGPGAVSADSDVDPLTLSTRVFSLAAGVVDATRDAGLVPDASVGHRVWLDDGDGLQAGGEPGVENVTVHLYESSNVLIDTTSTDASGHYAFSPGPGEYYLEFVPPAGMAFAPLDQGDDAADSDAAASGTTAVFTLAPGQVDTSRDAGIEPAVIGNRVWSDDNADGRQQPEERGLVGVTVRLRGAAEAEVAVTTTGADGVYQFPGVATGSYRIEVVAPTDGVFSAPDVGGGTFAADLIDSDVDPATGRSELFAYTSGTANRRWDAGLRLLPFFEDGFESGDLSAWSSSVGAGSQP